MVGINDYHTTLVRFDEVPVDGICIIDSTVCTKISNQAVRYNTAVGKEKVLAVEPYAVVKLATLYKDRNIH